MKRLLVVVVLVLAASAGYRLYGSPETGTGSLTLPQPAPNPGERAPSFEATSQNAQDEFKLSKDGVYVLTFWSVLNKDTEDARTRFDQLARDYEDKGVSFAAIYVNNAPKSDEDHPYAVLQDGSGELTARYNVKRVPRLFLINDGTIELVQNGFYPESTEQLKEALDRVLQEDSF